MNYDTEQIELGVIRLLDKAGVSMLAERIPARTDGSSWAGVESGHWQITFVPVKRTDYGRCISLQFSQGSGHRVWSKRVKHFYNWNTYGRMLSKRPKAGERLPSVGNPLAWEAIIKDYTEYPEPHPADILHSCILDSSACDMSFRDWCDEYGFDTDSIKADKMYRQCSEIGYNLRSLLNGVWSELSELVSEY